MTKQKIKVGVYDLDAKGKYPNISPYNPSTLYAEYPHKNYQKPHEKNYVYEGIRNLFFLLGYDSKNFGKPKWNPLGFLIKPGMNVVIKPNFVLSSHSQNKDLYSIVTHPSIIRAICDYCLISLKGKGSLTIADAPQHNCNFDRLIKTTKLNEVISYVNDNSNVKVKLLDLRDYWSVDRLHFPSNKRKLPGDPKGSIVVNLGKNSAFYGKDSPKYYGAVYNRKETISHHNGEIQEYAVSKTILDSDVLISIPKMKVHKKVGVTLNLKNMVGACTNKNYLVHYTLGLPSEGGDQFPQNILSSKHKMIIKFERWMYDNFLASQKKCLEYVHRLVYGFLYLKIFRNFGLTIPKNIRSLDAGNWYGNDSAWRMVSDLANIVYFSDKTGKIKKYKQRTLFSIIDGIIGGELMGPLEPDPKKSGVLIASDDYIAADTVATRLMGFDPDKINMLSKSNKYIFNKLGDSFNIKVVSNRTKIEDCLQNNHDKFYNYRPHPGWKKFIEI